MRSVVTTAIDVNAKISATNCGPNQRFISRSASVAVTSVALSLTCSPGYRAPNAWSRRATAAGRSVCTKIDPSSGVVWCPATSSGASSASPKARSRR